jgi:hypothetical protein
MIYSIYDRNTGIITGYTNSQDRAAQGPYIIGKWDAKLYYILRGQACQYPAKPSTLFWHKYDWDLNTQSWQLNLAQTDRAARIYRNNQFQYVDKVNPIWWASMTPEQQAITEQFRQDLLAVPQQVNFPIEIIWPNVPNFLRN